MIGLFQLNLHYRSRYNLIQGRWFAPSRKKSKTAYNTREKNEISKLLSAIVGSIPIRQKKEIKSIVDAIVVWGGEFEGLQSTSLSIAQKSFTENLFVDFIYEAAIFADAFRSWER